MKTLRSAVELKDGMHFMGELEGFGIPLDSEREFGGKEKGLRPRGLVLTALAGCTAMDVISILRKMREEPESFSVEAEAELADEHPKVFRAVRITYRLKGKGLARDKVERAVGLSQQKYCAVTAMLSKAAPIKTEIVIEE